MTDTVPAKIDPSQFVDKLRERIRSTLGELIPDDQWAAMMKAETERFFNRSREGSGYFARERQSDFQDIAVAVIADETRARFKAYFESSEDWRMRWNSSGENSAPKRIEAMIEANLPLLMKEVVTSFFAGLAGTASFNALRAVEQKLGQP